MSKSKKKIQIEIKEQDIEVDLSDSIIDISVHSVPQEAFDELSKVIEKKVVERYPKTEWVTFLAKVTMFLE